MIEKSKIRHPSFHPKFLPVNPCNCVSEPLEILELTLKASDNTSNNNIFICRAHTFVAHIISNLF